MNDPIQSWIEALKAKGLGADEISALAQGLLTGTSVNMYNLIASAFTEEDLKMIDAIADDNEAEAKIKEIFKSKTGATLEELATQLTDKTVQGHIQSLLAAPAAGAPLDPDES